MARPLRLEFPGAIYHVTARGNARQAIVLDDRDRALFLVCLGGAIVRRGWICHATHDDPLKGELIASKEMGAPD